MSLLRSLWSLPLAFAATPALAQTPLFEFQGGAAWEHLGNRVSTFDDLDGDGLPEIGAWLWAPSTWHVRVFRGSDGSLLKTILGVPTGDVNGDGLADRLVQMTAKEIGIYSGDSGPLLWEVNLDPTNSYAWVFGSEALDLGDVDGDAKDDVLVNEILTFPSLTTYVSQISVYSGADGSLIHSRQLQNSTGYPWAVPIGDVNGDQITEIALVDDQNQLYLIDPDGTERANWVMPFEVQLLGRPIIFAGGRDGADVDGDGIPDFGFSPDSNFGADQPTVIVSGKTGQVLYSAEGTAASLGGNFDSDGTPDLIIWNDAGLEVHSIATGSVLRRVHPTSPGVNWNSVNGAVLGVNPNPLFVAPIGDLDGDGLDELIVGENYPAASISGHGRVRVFTADASDEIGTRLTPPSALCPCGVPAPGTGCPNTTGVGATLTARGSASISEAHLVFAATELPAGEDVILFAGSGQLPNPTKFGAGVRLLTGPYQRVASHTKGKPVVALTDTHTFMSGPASAGIGAPFGFKQVWAAGQTFYLQAWYLDSPSAGAPCNQGFNLTNAVQLTMTP